MAICDVCKRKVKELYDVDIPNVFWVCKECLKRIRPSRLRPQLAGGDGKIHIR